MVKIGENWEKREENCRHRFGGNLNFVQKNSKLKSARVSVSMNNAISQNPVVKRGSVRRHSGGLLRR